MIAGWWLNQDFGQNRVTSKAGIYMNYHLLDDNHIEILAGDIAQGIWDFATDAISRDGEVAIALAKNVKSTEVRLKRQVGKLDTISDLPVSGIMGVVMGTLWGQVGGLAATAVGMAAGKSEYLCIGAQLKDGRKFIAYMSLSVYEAWRKACPDAKHVEKKAKKSGPFAFLGWH
jgi:hypothetical protein